MIRNIYDNFANEFDRTRRKVWNHVSSFLDTIEPNASVLELGCGNGKNMLYRTDLNFYGVDISTEQVNICNKKNLNVIQCDITNLFFNNNIFDYMICVATYHHLDNDIDRKKCLDEIYRTLKKDGKVLITVFAMEQPYYSKFKFTKSDELIPWNKNNYRYYHIYRNGELETEILKFNNHFKVIDKGWEIGNWWIILQK
jgi:ubiquinone/menaquinone biosynthesis C-methylase UbiE